MNDQFDDEPLLESSDAIPREAFDVAPAPQALRNAVWQKTSAQVRRTRMMRGALRVTASAALFVGGIVIGLIVASDRELAGEPSHEQAATLTETKTGDDDLLNNPEAFALRLQTAPKPERIALLQRAGDRYLNEVGNVELAMRCYQRMLEIGPESAENVDVNDSWLLMALKFDRQREKTSHEQPNA